MQTVRWHHNVLSIAEQHRVITEFRSVSFRGTGHRCYKIPEWVLNKETVSLFCK